jgi:hypothetical protein
MGARPNGENRPFSDSRSDRFRHSNVGVQFLAPGRFQLTTQFGNRRHERTAGEVAQVRRIVAECA